MNTLDNDCSMTKANLLWFMIYYIKDLIYPATFAPILSVFNLAKNNFSTRQLWKKFYVAKGERYIKHNELTLIHLPLIFCKDCLNSFITPFISFLDLLYYKYYKYYIT